MVTDVIEVPQNNKFKIIDLFSQFWPTCIIDALIYTLTVYIWHKKLIKKKTIKTYLKSAINFSSSGKSDENILLNSAWRFPVDFAVLAFFDEFFDRPDWPRLSSGPRRFLLLLVFPELGSGTIPWDADGEFSLPTASLTLMYTLFSAFIVFRRGFRKRYTL